MALDGSTLKVVENEKYYHGFLPREDIPYILKDVGDFLLRLTQPKAGKPRELVLSIRASMEPHSLSLRHIILTRQKNDSGGFYWIAVEDSKFESLKELVNYYVSSGRPINPEFKTSVLITGVGRKCWEFLHEDIRLKELLGEGQFGEVRAGVLDLGKGKKARVAVKITKEVKEEKELEEAKKKIKEMMHEARLMRNFFHDNIVRMYGVAVCREPLMIVLEKVSGGALFELLWQKKGEFGDEEKIENMSLGAAKGLEYLHGRMCIHRDIASRNVLYTENKVAKISDFGMSRIGLSYEMKKGGRKRIPLKWTAPESFGAFQFTSKSDVFSYSILLWEIFSDGAEPYEGLTVLQVKKMVTCGERMKKPEGCPEEMFKLIKRCWEHNPTKRYSMAEAVKYIEESVLNGGSDVTETQTTQLKRCDDVDIDDETQITRGNTVMSQVSSASNAVSRSLLRMSRKKSRNKKRQGRRVKSKESSRRKHR